MNNRPSDWNEDHELWEMLGKAPRNQPPTNFLHRVHQKVAAETRRKQLFPTFTSFSWVTRFAFASAVCAVLLFAFVLVPEQEREMVKYGIETSHPAQKIDLAELAQNFELIEDFEVIQNLDEL